MKCLLIYISKNISKKILIIKPLAKVPNLSKSKTPARLDRSILIVAHLRDYSVTAISFCFAISLIFSIVNFETLAISESG